MRRTHLKTLQLSEFRNWKSLKLETDHRHVVLVGENGAGKTNILEAISFLSPGRGLRRASYDAITLANGGTAWSVFAEVAGENGDVSIGTGISTEAERTRRIRINGANARSSEALLDHLRVSWLVPAMDGLFSDTSSERRRFLDRLVLAIHSDHGRRVSAFDKSMRARNRLLGEYNPDPAWLTAIEGQMAESATAITLARLEFLGLLQKVIDRETDPASPFPEAALSLTGELAKFADRPAADMEHDYAQALSQERSGDAASGRTSIGPHRSDLAVEHARKSMPAAQCSTGEQKALLIGIVLAHSQLVADLTGSAPVLLLDEVSAHLDQYRRAALFDRLEKLDCQAWMTGTDSAPFAALGERASVWRVAEHKVAME